MAQYENELIVLHDHVYKLIEPVKEKYTGRGRYKNTLKLLNEKVEEFSAEFPQYTPLKKGPSRTTLDRFFDPTWTKGIKRVTAHLLWYVLCGDDLYGDWYNSHKNAEPFITIPPERTAYVPETWVGRTELLERLVSKFQGQTRFLWMTGISGVGKTALGECLACKGYEDNPSFQFLSLDITEGQNPDFIAVAEEILSSEYFPKEKKVEKISAADRNNPAKVAKRLLSKLRERPYWILLNSVEYLFDDDNTDFVDDYWSTFLRDCVIKGIGNSRLIFTSQAFPRSLIEFSDRYPNVWAEMKLDGLSEQDEHISLFTKRNLNTDQLHQDILLRIAEIYEGHPLVLQVIAGDIFTNYDGHAFSYWNKYQAEFEQDARDIAAVRLDPNRYNRTFNDRVRQRITLSIERLPEDAFNLLCRSAVFRPAVPESFWEAMINDLEAERKTAAFRTLENRTLIEHEREKIRLHNLVRTIAYDQLRKQRPKDAEDESPWIKAEHLAVNLWLSEYQPSENASNLENTRGELEAFYHYCEIGKWEQAKEVLYSPGKPPNEQVIWMLYQWGYYSEIIKLANRILGKLDRSVDQLLLSTTAMVNNKLGDYHQAIELNNRSIEIAIENKNKNEEARIYGNLGNCYGNLSQYNEAIIYHQKQLTIARQIENKVFEANALANIGSANDSLKNHQVALQHFKDSLRIFREIGNRGSEGRVLSNMGLALNNLGKHKRAAVFLKKARQIAKESGDKYSEATALVNIGLSYGNLGQHEEALKHFDDYLRISKEIGYRRGEGIAYLNIGATNVEVGRYAEAIVDLQKARSILYEIGYQYGEADTLKVMAEAHWKMGDSPSAIGFCKKALELSVGAKLIDFSKECSKLLEEIVSSTSG
jgi:tetratricopeptide (TPR) repeat protein